jgi:ABC-type glycerol-3-phosphate transport system substrate-binding protein
MKRSIRLLTCILLACLSVSAFAGGKSDAPAAAPDTGRAAYNAPVTGTVQFWTFLDPKDPGLRSVVQGQLVEEFEKKYSVKVDVIYKYWADIPSDFIRATAGGIAPDVLRISMPKSWKQMLSAETLAPISDYAEFTDADKKDWVLPWDVYTDNGKKYAMPTSYQFVGLYTNPQHLAEIGAGIPKTWDELAETALNLSAKGYIGYVISPSRGAEVNNLFTFIEPALYGLGSKPVDDKGFATWGDSPEAVRIMEYFKKLVDSGAIPKEVLAWNDDDAHRGYMGKKVSMMTFGSQRIITTRQGGVPVEFSAIPGFTAGKPSPSYTSGWHLAMSRRAKNPRGGAEFIKFLTGTEAQVLNARIAGELPSRLSAYNDPWFSSSDEGKEMLKWKELLGEVGVMMDFYEDWLPMRQAFGDAAQEIILQGAPIKETLKKHADIFNSQRR